MAIGVAQSAGENEVRGADSSKYWSKYWLAHHMRVVVGSDGVGPGLKFDLHSRCDVRVAQPIISTSCRLISGVAPCGTRRTRGMGWDVALHCIALGSGLDCPLDN